MFPLQSFAYSIPYILVFFMLYMAAVPVSRRNVALVNRVPQTQLLFLVLFFFIGLRGYIFTDWKLYHPFWESCPSLWEGTTAVGRYVESGPFAYWEKGFLLYAILLKSLSSSWLFFQSVSFAIDFALLHSAFRRYAPRHVFLAFCIWYMFGGVIGLSLSINLMRNSKAVLLFFLSIGYAEEKSFLKYVALNAIGCLFHSISLLMLPLYFVLKTRWKPWLVLALFLLGNVVYLLQVGWVVPVIRAVADLLGGRLAELAAYYLNSSRWNFSYGITIGFLERTFTFVLLFCFRRQISAGRDGNSFLNAFYLYIFSYLYLSEMRILTDRIPIMFVCSYWVLLPRLYGVLKKDFKALFLVVFLCYALLKTMVGHRDILALYDNMLFPQFSIQQRLEMYNIYTSSEYWIN